MNNNKDKESFGKNSIPSPQRNRSIRGSPDTSINEYKNRIKEAIALIDRALVLSPNFNLASLSKQALESRLVVPEETQKD